MQDALELMATRRKRKRGKRRIEGSQITRYQPHWPRRRPGECLLNAQRFGWWTLSPPDVEEIAPYRQFQWFLPTSFADAPE